MTTWCVHARDETLANPTASRRTAGSTPPSPTPNAGWAMPRRRPVTLFVQDEATGAEHCVALDLRRGAVRDCG